MSDPVLEAHLREERFYLLSGPSPISIRDEMIRGTLLVERMMEQGIIGSDPSIPLLVIGAGVGGATAAITAARKNIKTYLVEKNDPFSRQRDAITRHVDPVQYDWPLDHWDAGVFPWGNHKDMPLSYKHGNGTSLYFTWATELRDEEVSNSNYLKIFDNDEILRLSVNPKKPSQLEAVAKVAGRLECGAAIWAGGFGKENCFSPSSKSPSYEGTTFWGIDSLKDLRIIRDPRPRVLISGSGDGALQDFIRIMTGLDYAKDAFINLGLDPETRKELSIEIQSAEDRAHRGLSWANFQSKWRQEHESPYLQEVETVHRNAVDRLLLDQNINDALEEMLLVTDPNGSGKHFLDVRIVFQEGYLTAYYGLNRFLATLFSEYISRASGQQTFFPNHEICDISPCDINHVCLQNTSPKRAEGTYVGDVLDKHACFCVDHNVTIKDLQNDLCFVEIFNVIVIRHGLLTVPLSPYTQQPLTLPSRSRHIWPYHMPVATP